ncbi:MAG TPA: SsgA family sporulation/cell division regulator [Mycobacteriales bacterium]|nr:SsgA family sporulation/cell division regulator [Mycobacteriales bacterium]
MSNIATVSADLELRMVVPGEPSLPVVASLHYTAEDPWAVSVTFAGEDMPAPITWLFARALLTEGVSGLVGDGDVRVWPSGRAEGRVVSIAMTSPSGAAVFETDRNSLVEFLQQTYLAVPTGCEGERVDLDAELALLLS